MFPRILKSLASKCLAWNGDDALLGCCSLYGKSILQGIFGDPKRSSRPSLLDDQKPALDSTNKRMEHEPLRMYRKDHIYM